MATNELLPEILNVKKIESRKSPKLSTQWEDNRKGEIEWIWEPRIKLK